MIFNAKAKLVLLILGAVVIAGCVGGGPPPVTGGYGAEIIDWSSDQTAVSGERNVRFTATVENQGQVLVNNTTALLYLTGSNIDLSGAAAASWRNTTVDDTAWRLFDKSLRAADPVRNITAERDTFRWTLKSPLLPRGQSRTDTFIARVYYDYKTEARGTVWVYSESEATAAQEAGRALERASFMSTTGPIGVAVTVAPDPPVLAAGDNSFTLSIALSNVGGGTVYKAGGINYASPATDMALDPTTELNRVNVAITEPSGMTVSADCKGEQELIGGRDITLTCDATVPTIPATLQGFPLTVTVTYGYYKDSTLSVTTTGR